VCLRSFTPSTAVPTHATMRICGTNLGSELAAVGFPLPGSIYNIPPCIFADTLRVDGLRSFIQRPRLGVFCVGSAPCGKTSEKTSRRSGESNSFSKVTTNSRGCPQREKARGAESSDSYTLPSPPDYAHHPPKQLKKGQQAHSQLQYPL
jgi:hypothetical protein